MACCRRHAADAAQSFIGGHRDLVGEGRSYLSDGDPPAAMARMRVAHDLMALYLIRLGAFSLILLAIARKNR